jgi:hypothetical protein
MAEYIITMVCTVTDPAERRRRLAEAYRILLEATCEPRQRPASRQDEITNSDHPADDEDGTEPSAE